MPMRKDIRKRMQWLSHLVWGVVAAIFVFLVMVVFPTPGYSIHWGESDFAQVFYYGSFIVGPLAGALVFWHRAKKEYAVLLEREELYSKPRSERGSAEDRYDETMARMAASQAKAREELRTAQEAGWDDLSGIGAGGGLEGFRGFFRNGYQSRRYPMSAKSRLLFILFVAGFVTFAMGIEAALVLAGIGAVYYGIWRGALGSFRLLNDREVNRDFHEALAASHERTKAESDDPRDKIRAATSAVKLLAETMLSAGDNIVEREAAMWQAQNLAGSLLPYDEIESIIELRRRSGEAEVVGDLLKDLRRGFDLIARQDVYKACIEVSVADGKVPRIQSELLQMISDGVGLDRATARMLYNRTYTAYRRRQEEGQNRYGRDRGAKRKKRKAYTHTSGSSQVEQRSALEILGLSPGASASEIKRAYHKLAMRFHPDRLAACSEHERLEAEVRFKEIVAAYESLKG